jgi:NitT/TauT family transport system permease protein
MRAFVSNGVAIALPVAAFFGIIGVWTTAIAVFGIPEYLLPHPKSVLTAALDPRTHLARQTMVTASEAVAGFVIANVLAFALAVIFSESVVLARSLFPYAIALKTTPVVAIAPILVVWFRTGLAAKVAAASLVSFFPVLVAVTEGLRAVDPAALDLFSSLGASRLQTMRLLRIPSAQTYLFPALKVSSSLSVVGAIVGEFVSPDAGLGQILTRSGYHLDNAAVFAALFASAGVGVTMFLLVGGAEGLATRWRRRGALPA